MILSEAYRRLGKTTEFDESLLSARAYTWSSRDRELHGELALYEGLRCWSERELDSARGYFEEALPRMSHVGKARVYESLGLVAASEEDYDRQVALLVDALYCLDRSDESDTWVESSLLYNLAALVPDLEFPDVMDLVARRAPNVRWTEATRVQQFQVYRCLGWAAALAGDHLLAIRRFREAADVAPSPAFTLFSCVDRAYLAREMKLDTVLHDALSSAERMVDSINWNDVSGEERIGLLLYAELRAADSPDRALMLMDRYKAIKRKYSPLLAAQSDRRWAATENYAYGIVTAGVGRHGAAEQHLVEAFEAYSSLKHTWLAVRTAAALYELTGNQKYAAYARDGVAPFKSSWLGERVYRLVA